MEIQRYNILKAAIKRVRSRTKIKGTVFDSVEGSITCPHDSLTKGQQN